MTKECRRKKREDGHKGKRDERMRKVGEASGPGTGTGSEHAAGRVCADYITPLGEKNARTRLDAVMAAGFRARWAFASEQSAHGISVAFRRFRSTSFRFSYPPSHKQTYRSPLPCHTHGNIGHLMTTCSHIFSLEHSGSNEAGRYCKVVAKRC